MYSPKIREDLIPRLYRLAQERGQPMTELVDQLLRRALELDKEVRIWSERSSESAKATSL